VSHNEQWRRYEQFRADRQFSEQTPARPPPRAIVDAYTGLQDQHVAFALASMLD
jgi:hypothetical protein